MFKYVSLIMLLLGLAMPGDMSAQSRKAKRHFTDARKAINAKEFPAALQSLEKALKSSPDYVDALLLKADLHQKMGEPEKSLSLYETAMAENAPYYVLLFYGESLFLTGRYEEAEKAFLQYIEHPRANPRYVEKAQAKIEDARFARQAVENPVDYNPQNLGPEVNSRWLEYFPSISADGETLVFTHRKTEGEETDEDFWVTTRDSASGSWTRARPLEGLLNTKLNEGAQALSSDGRVIFFAACDRPGGAGSCDIYASFLQRGQRWSKPVNLGDKINTGAWESQPSISSDGRTLYFVRGKNSLDQNTDIYYATLGKDGRWNEAQRLPGAVNTSGKETSPFIHFDNQHLYFSSDGHPGMGDLDFFVSRRQEDDTWGEPENLGYPINTSGEEFSLIVAPDGKTGYFASDNLPDGQGMLDLYSFELPPSSQAVEIAYIRGRVTDKSTEEPIAAEILFSDLSSGKVVLDEQSRKDGHYYSVLPANSDYALSIQKPGYLFYSRNFSLGTTEPDRAFVLNVELEPIAIGKKVKLENIFFALDSYELDERSRAEVNSLAQFLRSNPEVSIRIEGHTDRQGSAAYNDELSRNRARAVYRALMDKGIGKERLSYKGYGYTKPVASNETEEGRAQNRRTEVVITGD